MKTRHHGGVLTGSTPRSGPRACVVRGVARPPAGPSPDDTRRLRPSCDQRRRKEAEDQEHRERVSPPAYDGQEGDALALPEPRRQCTPRCLPYFSTANASRSTQGRPEVPTTTSLTVRVPEVDQVFCHASARYFVVVAYRSTVATYVPLT